ncbi:hypothetical protein H6M51_14705 [Rhizobium sp. AQ_MP]|uniref:hypothetical protein n=1 Tax=Rhizobium sp. AQ_MP TaxID=2761536 RepID=UPI00163982A6|nr:hypothetical protein [Rhizobium sp. AQ_MP]MBC2774112.1 hypothetical protein [Rhizobium sp. AQ_MP]
MAPVILVTFAGREARMQILNSYVRRAMADGLIDEWHIWDFTRSADDHDWVTREFGPVRYMGDNVGYQHRGAVSHKAALRMDALITNDLHIALLPKDDPDHVIEIVVGGWNNQQSVLRKLPRAMLKDFDRTQAPASWVRSTPGVLSSGRVNDVVLNIDSSGIPDLMVNGITVGRWPDITLSAGADVMVRGGWGGTLELTDVVAPVRRYIGNPGDQMPYFQCYQYYAKRLPDFVDALFLKCDDDIVYMDLDGLAGFIDHRRKNPHYFVTSANVVNNGVCAYFQQVSGALPLSLGHFERPPGGFGGTLWTDPSKANNLHDFFLAAPKKEFPLPAKVVDWQERQSINFIAWLGRDLQHMALARGDDEKMLTVDLPTFLERPTAIYSDFTVSHLSFGPQEKGVDVNRLITAYDALMREKLAL